MRILAKAASLLIWLSPLFDILRGPALFQLIWRRLVPCRELTEVEIEAASAVLSTPPIAFERVRVAQGSWLNLIFQRNSGRAFTTFHTLNLPADTPIAIVVHELAHVCQFETVGTKYMWQALKAQFEKGEAAYQYGGPDGLVEKHIHQEEYATFNREQQAQIAQNYFEYVLQEGRQLTAGQSAAYDHYVNQLRARNL